jgi:glycosyltransferase involved in cell wall biosynthesis
MRIGIHTQYYTPEIGAPQARLSDLARRFVARGHEVHVIAAMPNYPTGRVLPGYPRWWHREHDGTSQVTRSFIYPVQQVSLVPRLLSYGSFTTSSLLAGLAALPRLDYLLTESPPLFLGMSGYLLSRAKSARWIFNVSDLWPESAVRIGVLREGAALSLARNLEAFCYRHASLVTGQSRGILDDIRRRFPGVPTYHLSNGVDVSRFRADGAADPGRAGLGARHECLAVYAGLHGAAQGLGQLLEAAELLKDHVALRLVLVGDGPERAQLLERARAARLTNVRFVDAVPAERVPAVLAAADMVIACLVGDIPGAVPSKIYEGMACGRPLVLVGSGEPASIVADTGCGVAVPPQNPSALAAAVRRLADSPALRDELGLRGRAAAVARYSREAIGNAFIDKLEADPGLVHRAA